MKGDSIVYILQLAAGREFDQVPSVSQNELFTYKKDCQCFPLELFGFFLRI